MRGNENGKKRERKRGRQERERDAGWRKRSGMEEGGRGRLRVERK